MSFNRDHPQIRIVFTHEKEARKHMADTLSVTQILSLHKYKKRFSDRSALKRWQVQKIRKHLEYVGSIPGFTRE